MRNTYWMKGNNKSMHRKIPVIVISGTNASGKSSLGIELAQKYNGEIISADSRQVFNGFDLCCGKVTADEKALVPHHMIDICDISNVFSVSDYQKQVYKLIPQIDERGRLPFVVGGTGLYIDSVIKGYIFEDESIDYVYRKELENKTVDELHLMLSENAKKFLSANNSDYNNKRRLIRIIEKEKRGFSILPQNNPNMFNTLQIGVTWPKDILYKRIDDRLTKRIEKGMVEEVSSYIRNGGDIKCLLSLGLEYKYITWYLEGKYSTFDEFKVEMSNAIKRFAKQQINWFKRDSTINWINMTQDYFSEACNLIDAFLIRLN